MHTQTFQFGVQADLYRGYRQFAKAFTILGQRRDKLIQCSLLTTVVLELYSQDRAIRCVEHHNVDTVSTSLSCILTVEPVVTILKHGPKPIYLFEIREKLPLHRSLGITHTGRAQQTRLLGLFPWRNLSRVCTVAS
ncbi:hypothetical protein C380_02180 [Acidovorax sp. KKS102]|nr:hypothetical protein C380_02180 [Acidovorax sp. KKS102]